MTEAAEPAWLIWVDFLDESYKIGGVSDQRRRSRTHAVLPSDVWNLMGFVHHRAGRDRTTNRASSPQTVRLTVRLSLTWGFADAAWVM